MAINNFVFFDTKKLNVKKLFIYIQLLTSISHVHVKNVIPFQSVNIFVHQYFKSKCNISTLQLYINPLFFISSLKKKYDIKIDKWCNRQTG